MTPTDKEHISITIIKDTEMGIYFALCDGLIAQGVTKEDAIFAVRNEYFSRELYLLSLCN